MDFGGIGTTSLLASMVKDKFARELEAQKQQQWEAENTQRQNYLKIALENQARQQQQDYFDRLKAMATGQGEQISGAAMNEAIKYGINPDIAAQQFGAYESTASRQIAAEKAKQQLEAAQAQQALEHADWFHSREGYPPGTGGWGDAKAQIAGDKFAQQIFDDTHKQVLSSVPDTGIVNGQMVPLWKMEGNKKIALNPNGESWVKDEVNKRLDQQANSIPNNVLAGKVLAKSFKAQQPAQQTANPLVNAIQNLLSKPTGAITQPTISQYDPDVLDYAIKHKITPEQALQIKLKRMGKQ